MMLTDQAIRPSPVWISHRGFKEEAIENTLGAFQSAISLGFDALETDLRITGDGHIVLSHDRSLKRLFNLDVPVDRISRSALSELKLADGSSPLFLDDFAEAFADFYWVFDIKPETGERTIRALDRWADAAGIRQKLVLKTKFLAWRKGHEEMLQSLFTGATFYARQEECWRAGLAVMARLPGAGGIRTGRTYALPPAFFRIPLYQKRIVRYFHARGAKVVAFLPETRKQLRAAAEAGFNEILTNLNRL